MEAEPSSLNEFQGKVGQKTYRLNFITEGHSDVSHFTQGIYIYIQDPGDGYCYQQTFTQQNLPREVMTIFFDVRTLFDYIVDNYQDEKRVKLKEQGLLVSNILIIKSGQKRQEVMLNMTRSPLNKFVGASKIECYQNPEMKAYMYDLLTKNQKITQDTERMRRQFEELKVMLKQQDTIIMNLQQKYKQQRKQSLQKANQLNNKISNIERQNSQAINTIRVQQRYMIECINLLQRQLAAEKTQKEELRDTLKQLRDNLKKVKQGTSITTNSKEDLLGQKITVSIDKQNQYLNRFKILNCQIEKIKDDETRYQILGNQIMGKAGKTFFEVKIVKLATGNLLLGVVTLSRRGQRHSYNQKECVCFEATGMIFELGKKYPAVAKAQAGQTIRIVLDLEGSMVRWLVGLTEIGSVVLPDNMRNSKLVPYIELNEVGDKIVING